jgi:hypothetical protein
VIRRRRGYADGEEIRGRILRSQAGPTPSACAKNHRSLLFLSKPGTRSFWMTPKLSYIVILNLIANLSLLYHKPEKPAATRID